jgi:hypothetical protein
MVRAECPNCNREVGAVLRSPRVGPGDEQYWCALCHERIGADDVLTPYEALTDRDKEALGITLDESGDDGE